MMVRIAAVGMLALGLTIAGCGGGNSDPGAGGAKDAVVIAISAENVRFVPDAISVPAGKVVTITLKNLDESTEHDFEIEDLEATVIEGGS